jgi:site-specific DNA recombinase
MNCGHCGCALVGELKKGRYIYYHCTGHKGKCDEPYVREEIIREKFSEILGSLAIGDQVLSWVRVALREVMPTNRRNMTPLLSAYKLRTRIHAMYVDKLDGRIDSSFYAQMSETWQEELDKLLREIARQQAVDRSYLDEGARLIDLAHGAQRLFSGQEPHEQRRLLNFVLSNSTWKNGDLTATYRQPFDLIAEATAVAKSTESGGAQNTPEHPVWLGREGSNLRMVESKSTALPLGDAPMTFRKAAGR